MEIAGARKIKDFVLRVFITLSFVIIISILVIALTTIFYKGLKSFKIEMLFSLPRAVGEKGGGFANALFGSLIICAGTIVCFTPFGILLGVFNSLYQNTFLGKFTNTLINSLNSVPSIVTGVIAFIILVLPFKSFNVYSAIFALGIIYLPYVVVYTQEVVSKLSEQYMEQGLALGLSKFKTMIFLILRFSKSVIIFGVLSGFARIIGESAPLLFTAFGNTEIFDGFLQPISALPILIFTYAISPYKEWRNIAWAAALVMIVISLILYLSVSLFAKKTNE